MLNRTTMTPALYDYLIRTSVREPHAVRRLREQTEQMPESEMLVPPEEGQFLHLLVKLIGAKKALEVGVFTGYSALWTALALPEDGYLVGCDVSAEWTSVGRKYWQEAGVADRIRLRLGPASQTLQDMLDESQADTFDFAFIDADKANYFDYYMKVVQLVRPGGLIVLDNVLRSGEVLDPSIKEPGTVAVRKLNKRIMKDERVQTCMLPIADGVTLAIKRGPAPGDRRPQHVLDSFSE
ncbi:MAG: class I SAM-dependent methyltransferase [Acidobacteria bacterium]|nr:class I SAM-dependent methyltransferase [Acidobacteriota bacterium]